MHSSSEDPTGEFTQREFYQMRKHELDETLASTYWAMSKQPSLRKLVFTTIFLESYMMSSGVLVILSKKRKAHFGGRGGGLSRKEMKRSWLDLEYGSIIWKSLGFETVPTLNFQGRSQLAGIIFNVIAMPFMDKVNETT